MTKPTKPDSEPTEGKLSAITQAQVDAYKRERIKQAATYLQEAITHIRQEWGVDVVAVPLLSEDGRIGADIQLILK